MTRLNRHGQNVLEYTLIVAGAVAVSIVALRQGGLLDKTLNKSLNKSVSATECMALNTCYDPQGCPATCGNGCCESHSESPVTCNTDCECDDDADCNNGLYCDGVETCLNGKCLAGMALSVDDGIWCTVDACDNASGTITHTPDNTLCNDGMACNGVETCSASLDCVAGTPIDPDDGISCTVDTCVDPAGTVLNTPSNAFCDNGLFCDGSETCSTTAGCQSGTPPTLTDGIDCTIDTCDESIDTVLHTADNAACDNGQFCDGPETCSAAVGCQAGIPPSLNDGVGCTVDTCDETIDAAVHTPNNALCDDGLACNGVETCDTTADCQPGVSINVDDGIACTVDSCTDPMGTVVHTPNDAACDDTISCTLDSCDVSFGCVYTPDNTKCDDAIACTSDTCDATTGCVFTADDTKCDDAIACTTDSCSASLGCVFTTDNTLCNDTIACTDDTCSASAGCVYTPNNSKCSDTVACTDDTCSASAGCVYAPNNTLCSDGVGCTIDTCDASAGCQFTVDMTACGLGYYCDASLDCVAYQCTGTPPANTVLCTGDDTALSSSTPVSFADTCSIPQGSSPKCEYVCDSSLGYTKSGSECIACGDGTCNGSEVCTSCSGDCNCVPIIVEWGHFPVLSSADQGVTWLAWDASGSVSIAGGGTLSSVTTGSFESGQDSINSATSNSISFTSSMEHDQDSMEFTVAPTDLSNTMTFNVGWTTVSYTYNEIITAGYIVIPLGGMYGELHIIVNGTLSTGTPSGCTGPYNQIIPDGWSKIYYQSSTVACGTTCTLEIRACSGTTLSGSYTSPGCHAQPCTCTGPTPANATICAGDNTGVTADTPYSVVANGGCTVTKCEYECNLGYVVSGSSCIPAQCTGSIPANATMCSGDSTGLTMNEPRTVVSSCTTTAKCEYTCNTGYTASGGTCVPAQCTGAVPANAALCTGDSTGLAADTLRTAVTSCTTAAKCEYRCNSGYVLTAGACVPAQCTGTAPANAVLCTGDDTGLLADAPRTLVASCTTGTKCEYICDDAAGYIYDTSSGTCILKPSCDMPNPADTGTVLAGTTMSFYTSETMGCGISCVAYSRQCQLGGTWNGNSSAIYQNCSAPCADCTGPDASVIPHNTSKQYYLNGVEPCESYSLCTANSQMRLCYDGTLNGSYTNAACTDTPCGTCVNTIDPNANLCPYDNLGVPVDTDKTLVDACSSPDGSAPKCEYVCASGYHRSGTSCIPYVCTGTDPANATLCSGDDTGLTADTAKGLWNACDATYKCQYVCNSGYYRRYMGSGKYECTAYVCKDGWGVGLPIPNSTMCPGDNTGLTSDVWSTSVEDGGCTDAVKCEYECNPGYSRDSWGYCQKACMSFAPSNATLCPADDVGALLSVQPKVTTACSVPDGSDPKCEYTCNTGYVANLSSNWPIGVCEPATCISWTAPSNATICPGDDTGLTVHTSATLTAACSDPAGSDPKCQYTCASGYVLDSSNCMLPHCQHWPGSAPANTTMCPGDDTVTVAEHHMSQVFVTTCTDTRKCEYTCSSSAYYDGTGCKAYVCTGTMPANSSVCSGDNLGLPADTPSVMVTACSVPWGSSPKCEYKCNTGYAYTGGVCVPQCTGTTPANAALCTGDDTGLTAPVAKTAVTSCSAPDGSTPKCQYSCNSGYILSAGACVIPQCTGADPANAALCSGDDSGLTANVAKTVVSSCSAPAGSSPKCEYACNSGYVLSGGACIIPQCTGTDPANAALCSGDDTGLAGDVAKTVVSSCSAPAGSDPKCEYLCNSGYVPSGGICIIPQCTGTDPANATLCSGDDTALPSDVAKTLVSGCTDTTKCEYTCNSGYVLSGGVCIIPQCTGTVPSYAQMCAGDDAGLTGNVARTLKASCSAPAGSTPKCEYTCNTGFTLVGGVCVGCGDGQCNNGETCLTCAQDCGATTISAQAYEYDPSAAKGCQPCSTTAYIQCNASGNLSYRVVTSYSSGYGWGSGCQVVGGSMCTYTTYDAPYTADTDTGYVYVGPPQTINWSGVYPTQYQCSYSGSSCTSTTPGMTNGGTATGAMSFDPATKTLSVQNTHWDGSITSGSASF